MKTKQQPPDEGGTKKRGRKSKADGGRKNGEGTLQKHGKNWRAVWIVNGVTFRRSTGTADKREAAERLAKFVEPYRLQGEVARDEKDARAARRVARLQRMDNAADFLALRAERKQQEADDETALPLAEAWRAFDGSLYHKKWAKSTHDLNETRVEAFLEWMRREYPLVTAARDVGGRHANEYLQTIRAARSGKTFNDYRAILMQTWDGLRKLPGSGVRENPWRDIEREEVEDSVRRALTAEELARVLSTVKGEMRTLFAIGMYTSLRLGDAVTLDWGKVDMVGGFIRLKPKKTKRHKAKAEIPIHRVLWGILSQTPEGRRRGKVLPRLAAEYQDKDGKLLCGGMNVVRKVQNAFRAAGIETQVATDRKNKDGTARKAVEVGYHSLRHSVISFMGNKGVPLALVKTIAGHLSETMTERYFHAEERPLREAINLIPDFTAKRHRGREVEDAVIVAEPRDKAREAVEAFRTACEALTGAGLTKDDWREVARILAAVEKARRA